MPRVVQDHDLGDCDDSFINTHFSSAEKRSEYPNIAIRCNEIYKRQLGRELMDRMTGENVIVPDRFDGYTLRGKNLTFISLDDLEGGLNGR